MKITFTSVTLFFSLCITLLDQITIAKNNNSSTTTSEKKPVSNEDRRTHTNDEQHVETESTKHNADKVSCNSIVTIARSQKEEIPKCDNKAESENYRVLVETESWRTAKNWKSDSKSSSIRTDQGNYIAFLSHGLPSLMFSFDVFSSF
jgi:hypothetical protein